MPDEDDHQNLHCECNRRETVSLCRNYLIIESISFVEYSIWYFVARIWQYIEAESIKYWTNIIIWRHRNKNKIVGETLLLCSRFFKMKNNISFSRSKRWILCKFMFDCYFDAFLKTYIINVYSNRTLIDRRMLLFFCSIIYFFRTCFLQNIEHTQ